MKDGQFAKKIRLVFEKDGKKYEIPSTNTGVPFWSEDFRDWNWYWWESGNGSCDDNRSSLIHEFYPDFLWDFNVTYHDNPEEICAKIEMRTEYKNALISIHNDIFKNLKKEELEEMIVHELCHCIIQPILEVAGRAANGVLVTEQELNWHKEQVTQHITRSIL